MIRDIGQGCHDKRWKLGIVRVRGKAGRGGGRAKKKKKTFSFFFLATPPPPLPATLNYS